jgi:hypothetical protein
LLALLVTHELPRAIDKVGNHVVNGTWCRQACDAWHAESSADVCRGCVKD